MKKPEIASPGENLEENKATIGLWKVDRSEVFNLNALQILHK
jgi:hypothetical protein